MFIILLSMFGCGDNDCSPFLEVTVLGIRGLINKNEIISAAEESDKKYMLVSTLRSGLIETENSYDDITRQLGCTK